MHRPEPNYNLAAQLLKRAQLDPDYVAVHFEGTAQTYGELGARVRRLAGLLKSRGVCKGDRVGFLGFNHPTFFETLYASAVLGAIFVPLNFRLTGEELRFIINDAGVHTLVADPELIPVLAAVQGDLVCRQFFSLADAQGNFADINAAIAEAEDYAEAMRLGAHDELLIMYTSGTTGLPKGAVLTHGNIIWNNVNANLAFGGNREDTQLVAAPLFHIGGLNSMTLSALQQGATLVVLKHFDPGQVLAAIERYQVRTMFGAPAMYLFMVQHPDFDQTNLDSLHLLTVGGAPCPEALIEKYQSHGVQICQGYGLTETAPFCSFLSPDKTLEKLGSAGKPPILTDLRIVDSQNEPVPAGEQGEVVIRGPNVMKGYWNRPDATAEAIDAEGWFHTGDIGYLDNEGYLFICDRLKDMVISGGENVYPAEVESVLYTHPSIAEVAVIGLPDDKWGEAVTAVVALHSGESLSLEALREFATPHLARYKIPLRLEIVESLPRNPAGKVLKFQLRKRYS